MSVYIASFLLSEQQVSYVGHLGPFREEISIKLIFFSLQKSYTQTLLTKLISILAKWWMNQEPYPYSTWEGWVFICLFLI